MTDDVEGHEPPGRREERPEARERQEPREPRPIIERIGLAAIAAVLAILFGGVAAAAWVGGEIFLAAMGAIGCLMTAWVGALTLFRG
ncbi:MAG TPA: hypothetical protein VD763_10285 [Candidatus Saccharimonadales bacterium]|nr:hypothetical protein [Candidatus Saccharimonadales bacterium]